MKKFFVLSMMFSTTLAFGACETGYFPTTESETTKKFIVCDTEAEIPSSGFSEGDLVYAKDTKILKVANSGTTVVAPFIDTPIYLELPQGVTPPTVDCDAAEEAGRIYYDTDATTGRRIYACEGVSGWILQGDGGAGGGEANTSSNSGTGNQLALAKSGVDLPFRTLISGDNVSMSTGTNDITINVPTNAGTTLSSDLEEETHGSEHDGTDGDYLADSGDTLIGELVADDLGIEFTPGDTLTDCSAFATTGGGIFYDDSEGKFKKCQDNTLTDMDTSGGSPAWGSITGTLSSQTDLQTALDAKAPIASPTFTGTVTMPTGDANNAPLKLVAQTVQTTPADGSIEIDADSFYAATDTGNRRYIPIRHFIRCNATRTLPNDTNVNPIFASPTNGRLTLETGTYLFEMMVGIDTMSATSGNALLNILGAGTATVNDWLYSVVGKDGTLVSVTAVLGTMPVTSSTPASMFTAGTGAAMWFTVKGTFTVTVEGTLIPSIDQVTGAAAIVKIGSYFTCERIGSTSVVSVGQWD